MITTLGSLLLTGVEADLIYVFEKLKFSISALPLDAISIGHAEKEDSFNSILALSRTFHVVIHVENICNTAQSPSEHCIENFDVSKSYNSFNRKIYSQKLEQENFTNFFTCKLLYSFHKPDVHRAFCTVCFYFLCSGAILKYVLRKAYLRCTGSYY